jgi:hypothetical protein
MSDAPLIGAFDSLVIRLLKDLVFNLDEDPYLELFEDLIDLGMTDDGDLEVDDVDKYQDQLDALQARAMARLGRALINMGSGKDRDDRLVREMKRQIKAEFDGEEAPPEEPHVILVGPQHHLVRQV